MRLILIIVLFSNLSSYAQSSLQERMQMESESVSLSEDECLYYLFGSGAETEGKSEERVSRKECFRIARAALEQSEIHYRKVLVKHSGKIEMFYREKTKLRAFSFSSEF